MTPRLLEKFAARKNVCPVQCHLVLNEAGLVLGVTMLAKRVDGELRLAEKRVLTLLAIAQAQVPAQKALNYIRNAEKHYQQGNALMCSMALALTGVHVLTKIEQAHDLFIAEEFLSAGGTELELLKHCGIESVLDDPNALALFKRIGKFNPYHRGAGPEGGQFTTANQAGSDIAGTISTPSHIDDFDTDNPVGYHYSPELLGALTTPAPKLPPDGSNDRAEAVYPVENLIVALGAGEVVQGIRGAGAVLET